MKGNYCMALLALLLSCSVALSSESPVPPEIDYLLKYIEKSNCEFIRSGKSYTPAEAVAHLRSKLSNSGGRVTTAELFIEHIASKSYLTGKDYLVKLPGSTDPQPTGPWLTQALKEHRQGTSRSGQ